MERFYLKILTRKLLISLSILFGIFLGLTYAAEIDTFLVQVEPDTFNVGEPVDITISAAKNGTIVKDYIGDVFIGVIGLMEDDYTVPSNGVYSFLIQDQGEKVFSKGLQIQKPGTYTVEISDIMDETILGETTIIVGDGNNQGDMKSIDIISPVSDSIEKVSSVNIIGSSTDLPNSPIEVYLDNQPVENGYTDAQGNFNIYISGLQSGENRIEIKILDINDIVLGQSDVVVIKYEPISDGIFKSIEILPVNDLKQGDQTTFNIYTAEEVTSAELKFSNNKTFPLDRVSPGVFSTTTTLLSQGTIKLSLSLIANGNTQEYKNISDIFVKENITVSNIKFDSVGVDGKSVTVSRDPIGDSPNYKISYGTNRDNLQKTINISSTKVLVENLQVDTIYYFQIDPLDQNSHAAGASSPIVEYSPNDTNAACSVKGISISSEKIGDKYYLIRDLIDNVDKYEIYKSDRKDMSDKKKIGETKETRFEYYFDEEAQKDEYTYYQVQAVCSDGSSVTIDEAKKVKVGPFENTILIIIITLFLYSIYRLYKTVE